MPSQVASGVLLTSGAASVYRYFAPSGQLLFSGTILTPGGTIAASGNVILVSGTTISLNRTAVTLISKATGNTTNASTWATCDPTAELDSDTSAVTLTTANTDSTTFTLPSTVAVDAVAIKLSLIITPTGTLTVTLRNSTAGTTAGTVTINASDLPGSALAGGTTAGTMGWFVFPFASFTPNGSDSYLVRVTRSITDSGSSRISLSASTASALNICRQVRRVSTPITPATGDKLIIAGELTGAGTGNSFVLTMDNTSQSSTSFGTTALVQSVSVSYRATLAFGTAASTLYFFKLKGIFRVFLGGTVTMGTLAVPVPATSAAEVLFDVTVNVDSGLVVDGTFTSYGATKTSWTRMTADKAAAANVIALSTTSGWAINDTLCFPSTSRTASEAETKNILTVDSSTQVTLTAGLTNAHLGTSPMQCEVGNLTRTVKIHGTSTSLQGYIIVNATGTWSSTYTEIYNLGSATTGKRGLDMGMTTTGGGTASFSNCAVHDFVVASSSGWNLTSAFGTGLTIDSCVCYNIAQTQLILASTLGTWTVTNNLFAVTVSSSIASFVDLGGTFTGNILTSASGAASMSAPEAPLSWSGNVIHSNSVGITFSSIGGVATLFGSTKMWRNGGSAAMTCNCAMADTTFDSWQFWGNASTQITNGSAIGLCCTFTNCGFSGDATFSTGSAFSLVNGVHRITCISCDFGASDAGTTAHTSADIAIAAGSANQVIPQISMYNCILRATTQVSSFTTTNSPLGSYILSQKNNQTAGNHKTWRATGIITTDSTILDGSNITVRATPNTASYKLETPVCSIAVRSGTTASISAKVRESVLADLTAYTGSRIRLIVKKNVAAGISADTVLATATSASSGAFQTISGTTASVTDNCALDFVVDCDGAAGWINIGAVIPSGGKNTSTLQYFKDGQPFNTNLPSGVLNYGILTGGQL